MSVVTRCGAVSLMLGLLVGAAPALAQTETAGSSWTDPPVRGSAEPATPVKPDIKTPAAEAPPPAVEKPARRAAAPPPATPAERAASALGVKPVAGGGRAAANDVQTRRPVVRPRMVERPLVIARRPGRIVERPVRRLTQRGTQSYARSYAQAPDAEIYGRVDPYDGRGYASSSPRRLAGWGGLIDDSRAGRIARAREAGYTVMRMQTYAYPDGSRVRQLSPYDGGYGDLD